MSHDTKSPFRIYTGDSLLEIEESRSHPIVEAFLYENDYVLLVAKEKMGKSLIAMQLACNISSGTTFLDTLEVRNPLPIWYFSLEGKDDDMKMRLINMEKKVPLNKDNFSLICTPGFEFNTGYGVRLLEELIHEKKDNLPRVIIIDPLYMAIKGSIKDDNVITDFTKVMRKLQDRCNASIIVIHHSKRPIRLQNGAILDIGDDEMFGSAFLKASVDHIFYLISIANSDHKILRCRTQRSGHIMDDLEVRLIQPDPLYFEYAGHIPNMKDELEKLMVDWTTVKDLQKMTGKSRAGIYNVLKDMKLDKINSRPVKYKLKK